MTATEGSPGRGRTPRVGRAVAFLGASLFLVACQVVLTEPAEERPVAFQLVAPDSIPFGDLTPMLDSVDRAGFSITSAAGTRDTVVAARVVAGRAEARLLLRPEESFDWLRIRAELRAGGRALFSAEILEYAYGVTSERSIPVLPVVRRITVDGVWPEITALGDTITLEGRPRFATGELIPGLPVVWISEDPGVLEQVAPARFVARSNGVVGLQAEALGTRFRREARVAQAPAQLIGVAPTDTTIAAGEEFALRPIGFDRAGFPLQPGSLIPWRGQGPAAVSRTGVVTGQFPGVGTVSTGFDGVAYVVTVTVTGS